MPVLSYDIAVIHSRNIMPSRSYDHTLHNTWLLHEIHLAGSTIYPKYSLTLLKYIFIQTVSWAGLLIRSLALCDDLRVTSLGCRWKREAIQIWIQGREEPWPGSILAQPHLRSFVCSNCQRKRREVTPDHCTVPVISSQNCLGKYIY